MGFLAKSTTPAIATKFLEQPREGQTRSGWGGRITLKDYAEIIEAAPSPLVSLTTLPEGGCLKPCFEVVNVVHANNTCGIRHPLLAR